VDSLKVGQGARPWDFSPWSWCSHQSCTRMFSSYFSVGFIDMVSLIKICFVSLINICFKPINLSLNFVGILCFR
jgi:hypothetical protein